MKITIDTDNLSELDINMLTFLAENGEVVEAPAPEAAPAKAEPKPEKVKAEPKPAKVEEPAPVEEPEAEEVDPLEAAPTMSDAVAAATALVSSGNAAKVKEALAKVGDVKRVSELKEDQISKFLAALEG